jgi:uncharacterized membrane protein YozB (DUF420 family)
MIAAAHPLVHLNAALNALATVLLIVAWRQIRAGRETAHGRTMVAALGVSAAFLVSYLAYHAMAGSVRFTHPGVVRYVYYFILLTHVVLAAAVPVLAVWAAWLGVRALGWRGGVPSPEAGAALRRSHRRVVRWAYPIWIYVSVTGVLVYLMLYHLWPPDALAS